VIDRELETRKIVLISGDLEELRKLDSAGLEAYLADPLSPTCRSTFRPCSRSLADLPSFQCVATHAKFPSLYAILRPAAPHAHRRKPVRAKHFLWKHAWETNFL
jgi:hypothetical protein